MKNYNKILEAVNRGIKFALDDYEDNEQVHGQTNSKINHQHGTKEWLDLINDVVDLELPSGTLWCKYNLGVNPNQLSKPENWYGDYYAWGEIKTKWSTYKYAEHYIDLSEKESLTKYCNDPKYGLHGFTDNLTQLLSEDDAAYQNKKLYNYKFHIPTKEQCEELLKYTNKFWVNNYDPNKTVHNPKDDEGIQGLYGRIFEGRNGNQLFIPAAGYGNQYSSDIVCIGSNCNIWSSSFNLDGAINAYYLYFDQANIKLFDDERCYGFTVHPVIKL